MKPIILKNNYSEFSLEEQVAFSSDDTTDTAFTKIKSSKGNKQKNSNLYFISKNINTKRKKRFRDLSVLDDFKLILFGCMGIRTYKMVYCF
ncbi:conserved Plasmodium protein, unknown function [Plasmodium berghei]|uniref:Uncharacterized protein n=2 Tax=Plasmodium berghei TaxID=5821 RepID=A0A509ANX7_PLABA|nr:conserved Plasmodium protein, unknown function [Plasmodium berghei ANKA]CXI81958.1 conserved Plasmodium protein, unknown function [Plasmodium berghei]SCM25567.1 conserved Plasmodium protein, unknown function [Plasmodium berghei]SCN27406.1 conserved Plasmodium protein, unknown function [Plasmodium berghei]SCO62082.1 conserved Plasmodium protein, unknown function [Plasmodium berghei]SCO63833.1 conserved Plasmodium protein, unknown function [Plasmodium berghei]|eukprot:XP_034423039.1 conserved Plasmodium protein, unknown function [Plasmodium berghei ANKA]